MTDYFLSARAVGGGRPIVLTPVEILLTVRPNKEDRKDIAKLITAVKSIAVINARGDCANLKKPWATLLQTSFLLCYLPLKIRHCSPLAAIFAGQEVSLWTNFLVEVMEPDAFWSLINKKFFREGVMITKKTLVSHRVRRISGSFAWVPHHFLRKGFWGSLNHHELLLYLFLALVADRQGMSYYSFDKICSQLSITPEEYILARNSLIDKDLIAFDGHMYQVLSLPEEATPRQLSPLKTQAEMRYRDPATIRQIIRRSLGNDQ